MQMDFRKCVFLSFFADLATAQKLKKQLLSAAASKTFANNDVKNYFLLQLVHLVVFGRSKQ